MIESQMELKGFDELDRKLHELPGKVGKKALADSTKAGGKVIRDEAERRLGFSKKHLSMRTKSSMDGTAETKVIPRKDKWYLRLIEFGTSPIRKVKKKKVLYSAKLGKFFGKDVKGLSARPFMRPAFDSKKEEAVRAMGDVLGRKIEELGKEKT